MFKAAPQVVRLHHETAMDMAQKSLYQRNSHYFPEVLVLIYVLRISRQLIYDTLERSLLSYYGSPRCLTTTLSAFHTAVRVSNGKISASYGAYGQLLSDNSRHKSSLQCPSGQRPPVQ